MATAKIKIENGFFVDYSGRYLDSLEPTRVVGNDWKCTVNEDGSILCECAREYSDGLHSIRYTIQKNGYAKLTLKTPEEFKVLRKGYVTPKGVPFGNGILGLAGGNVDDRYAYYRDSSFQDFLNTFGITAVKSEDPNQKFSGFANYSGWGTATQKVYSDGRVEWNYKDAPGSRECFEQPGANPNLYSGTVYHNVTGATWTIVENEEHYLNNHNYSKILYTKVKNVMELKDSIYNVLKTR